LVNYRGNEVCALVAKEKEENQQNKVFHPEKIKIQTVK
jgi:hypothetical protein